MFTEYARIHTHAHTHTMNAVLLEALPWSKVDVSCHFAHFNVALNVATFIDLIFYLVTPALIDTLGYS